jgi:ADP-ribosyl-[dinitrogen reductase] hydrolase
MTIESKAKGCLLGLACGDALGRPVEFRSRAQIEREYGRLTEMVGGGTHGKPAGTVTDDTDLALCIARSLVERDGFDPEDVGDRFVAWLDSGPFDVGLMTADAIRNLKRGVPWDEAGHRVWETRPEGSNAGNGSVMRCVPHAIRFGDDWDELERVSRDSSRITHADPRCTTGCAILNCTVAALARDVTDPLARALDHVDDVPGELEDALEGVPDGLDATTLEHSGYVVHTLQAGLSHGLSATTAEEGIVAAVNTGGDTDTLGAVTGAIVGARFGVEAVPERWRNQLAVGDELGDLGAELASTSDRALSTVRRLSRPGGSHRRLVRAGTRVLTATAVTRTCGRALLSRSITPRSRPERRARCPTRSSPRSGPAPTRSTRSPTPRRRR